MADSHQVAVLGGGSFGTVIANIVAGGGFETRLWVRDASRAALINREQENRDYLPGYRLHEGLRATSDLAEGVDGATVLLVAVPSKSFRDVVALAAPHLPAQTLVVSLTKGLEPDPVGGFNLMSEILREELPRHHVGVLSGPNLAAEIAAGHITGSVIASPSDLLIDTVVALMHRGSFRVYRSGDMYGVEMGGALKNIYAILAGLAAALDLGQNTIGMLLTRGLAEMSRFAVHLGANPLTFLGLSGVGDLLVTCSSPLSRNYRVGYAVGKGEALEQVLAGLGQVAEGITTLRLVKEQADQRGINMPLVSGLYAILYEGMTTWQVMRRMIELEQAQDVEFVVRGGG
jgi:glycerol-3-phosphate dehydrogenase (NAD(P)+)